jgi:hypothetical protein
MNQIKFSHLYAKMHNASEPNYTRATLLLCTKIRLETLPDVFLDADTLYFEKQPEGMQAKHYPLPKKGEFLFLLFQFDGGMMFTTLRRSTPQKEEYYRERIGQDFEVVIE